MFHQDGLSRTFGIWWMPSCTSTKKASICTNYEGINNRLQYNVNACTIPIYWRFGNFYIEHWASSCTRASLNLSFLRFSLDDRKCLPFWTGFWCSDLSKSKIKKIKKKLLDCRFSFGTWNMLVGKFQPLDSRGWNRLGIQSFLLMDVLVQMFSGWKQYADNIGHAGDLCDYACDHTFIPI